jgi:hypothetical protein
MRNADDAPTLADVALFANIRGAPWVPRLLADLADEHISVLVANDWGGPEPDPIALDRLTARIRAHRVLAVAVGGHSDRSEPLEVVGLAVDAVRATHGEQELVVWIGDPDGSSVRDAYAGAESVGARRAVRVFVLAAIEAFQLQNVTIVENVAELTDAITRAARRSGYSV